MRSVDCSGFGSGHAAVPRLAAAFVLFIALGFGGCGEVVSQTLTNALSPVRVSLEKRIKMPAREGQLVVLTRVAWSEATNQIATVPFASNLLYIVDPESGAAIGSEMRMKGAAEPSLSWSRKRPLLVISRGTRTLVLDTGQSPERTPIPTNQIDHVLPKPLLTDGASTVETDGDEWIVLAGETNRKLDPTNVEIVAHSISSGDQMLAWHFPGGKDTYRLIKPSAAKANGHLIVAGWVQHVEPPSENSPDPISNHELWVIRPDVEGPQCRAFPLKELPQTVFVPTEEPALSADGKYLAVAEGRHLYVHVYRTADCQEERTLPLPEGPNPRYLTFSADGRWLLGTSPMHQGRDEGRIYLWRTSDWKLVHEAVQLTPYQAAFNKDGTRFAVATVAGLYIYRITER